MSTSFTPGVKFCCRVHPGGRTIEIQSPHQEWTDFAVAACNAQDELYEALMIADRLTDALRAYVPAHMFASYLLDRDAIDNALAKVRP